MSLVTEPPLPVSSYLAALLPYSAHFYGRLLFLVFVGVCMCVVIRSEPHKHFLLDI